VYWIIMSDQTTSTLSTTEKQEVFWIFGYGRRQLTKHYYDFDDLVTKIGSLIWRTYFTYLRRVNGFIKKWKRGK
jgi:cation transport regulator ChaC